MKELGLEVLTNYLVNEEEIPNIEKATRKLLALRKRPTAIFCASDHYAMIVMRTARQMELTIPDDLSVVGYANLSFAKLADPPLTTISEPFDSMGQIVATELINEIDNKNKITFSQQLERILEVELIIRNSTAEKK